jgi:REP element-mobilizing transposase RayT/predicted transcriptional regulator
MPRRPRVDMVGYYHVLNRGVEQRVVYKDDEDYNKFLFIVCEASKLFDVNLHSYVLMNNHYHLLIETKKDNLSNFMKHINGTYAIYFNKKHSRSGYLWQGRYRSWYVTDDTYLYTLIRYIENNPLKAKLIKCIDDYRYSSYNSFIKKVQPIECLKNSIMFEQFDSVDDIRGFFEFSVDENILSEIKKSSNLVATSIKKPVKDIEKLKEIFKNEEQRDGGICKAYAEGYTQTQIAEFLDLTQAGISKIVKRTRGGL